MTTGRWVVAGSYLLMTAAIIARPKAPTSWNTLFLVVMAAALLNGIYFSLREQRRQGKRTLLQVLYYSLWGIAIIPAISVIIAAASGQAGPILSSLAGLLVVGGLAFYLRRMLRAGHS